MPDAPLIPLYPLPPPPLSLDPVQEESEGEEAVMVAPSPAVLPASSGLVVVASTALFAPITPSDVIAKKARKPRFLKAAGPTTPELTLQMPTAAAFAEFDFGFGGRVCPLGEGKEEE